MGQPGADDDERQPGLADLVSTGAQRRDVLRPEVLHLVDEHRDPATGVRRHPPDVGEQLDEVDLDVARVGPTGHCGDRDPGVPALPQLRRGPAPARGGPDRLALRERADDPERVVAGPTGGAELAHRLVQRRRQRSAQRLVGSGLELAGPPPGPDRGRAEGVEQDRLADPAQPGEDDRPLGTAAGDALENDVEAVELLVPARELGGSLAGAGGVGVPDGVHDRSVWGSLASARYIGREPDRVSRGNARTCVRGGPSTGPIPASAAL